jgi:hypothetical protein
MSATFLYQRKSQLLILALACLVFVLIVQPWTLYFLNDDFLHIPMDNDRLFLRTGFMRPVPNFFLMWDKMLYGRNANGFFFTSLILHGACVFAIFFLVGKIEESFFPNNDETLLALITALLFLFYPYHAEPVMWVIGRVAIMAALFTFLSLLCYLKSKESILYLLLAWLLFVIALFTYESIWNVIGLFAIISFFNVYNEKSSLRKEALRFVTMFVTFAAYIWFRWYILGTVAGDGYLEINPNLHKFQLLVTNLIKLTGRNFTPPFINSWIWTAFCAVSFIFYGWLVYKVFKKNRPFAFFMMLLWVALVSGVITAAPLGIDTHYNESERYIYYSSFFFCLFIASLLTWFLSRQYQLIVSVMLCGLFGTLLLLLQRNYKKASAITKATVHMYNTYPNYKRAYTIDMPAKYKGTMVLRLSPTTLMNWMAPAATYDTILALSQTVNMPIELPYKTGEKSWAELAAAKNWKINQVAIADSLGRQVPLFSNYIFYWYTPEGLYKINVPDSLAQKPIP